ncbi:hypothetical protein [Candidatus Nitrosacidococcus tergens]|uniref:hypothetical protein n=1 Tax=Candidatus Nitrosacidococcus tergens TaxID=553981 RepID=UPI001E4F76CC|nr:hypothetical protein [Candidatus Nitrosacidococcus tergens]
MKGRFSNEGRDYLVEKIVGLEVSARLPRTTRITHVFFQEKKEGEGSTQHIAVPIESVVDDEDLQLDDEATANIDIDTRVIETDPTWVSFSRPSQIEKSYKARKSSQIIIEKEETATGGNSNLFSTDDESHLGGVLAAADVSGKQDATNYNYIFANHFAAFNELIVIPKTKFGYHVIFEEILVLPKIGRSRLHLCKDGSPTTKALTGVDRETWQSDFERIRCEVVKGSLN